MKAIIIDDEEGARTTLASLLREYCPQVEVVAECSQVPEAVLAINRHNPDVVFLDIEMPEYSGLELPGFFKEINFEIVFVTAYSQYAIRAFELSAISYLLKPVDLDQLRQAVEKVAERKNLSSINQRVELAREAFHGGDIRKIALPMNDGLLFVDIGEIVLLEADRVYTNVILRNGSKIVVSKPLKTFEDILENRPFMFRPHRSFLINLNYMKKYLRGESMILMDNNVSVAVSRERKQAFENLLRELKLFV